MAAQEPDNQTTTASALQKKLQSLGVDSPIPSFKGTDVLTNPVDIYRCYLADALATIIDCDRQLVYEAIQWTNQSSHGDLLLVVPRLRLKGVKPIELTNDLSGNVRGPFSDVPSMGGMLPSSPLFAAPIPAGIQLQLRFSSTTLPQILLPYIFERGSSYGGNPSLGFKDGQLNGSRKRMVIDFSSPNIAKEFHAGHLRSTIIGAYLSNLYQSMGWDVVKLNYLGDWGKQFGLLAVGWKRFGSEELLQQNPLGHLLDVYVKINTLFSQEEKAVKEARERGEDTAELESRGLYAERNDFFTRMEEREPEALALWKRFRDVSIERYISAYARLNIQFDEYWGESQVQPKSIEKAEAILIEKGILKEDRNALIVNFKDHGAPKLDVAVVRNRQGTSTYLLRDIAGVFEREEKYQPDQLVYVVSSEQDVYFQRLFKIIELMGRPDLSSKLQHVNFGKVLGMSSRLGTVRLLSDILDDSGNAMHEVMKRNETKYAQVEDPVRVSDTLGITAVMVQDMSGKRINNYPFDMSRMMSFEGDTGPYLQYTHARLCSIMRKAGFTTPQLRSADFSLLREQHVIDNLRLMAQFPDVTQTAFKTLEPTTILTYLFKFTHQLSSGYDVVKVIGVEDKAISMARAAYYDCARQVLHNGLRLLGITPVER
ncbi:MAG: hypothetical protein Q9200_007335 [Gallowayella weberi]